MNMKTTLSRWALSTGCILLALSGQAQGLDDVMLYGRMDPLGTARSTGLGGAMTALGADLGAIGINPAGLGMYRSSDMSFTLGLGAGGARTAFAGESTVTAAPHLIVGQIGGAITTPMNSPHFKRGTFAFAYRPLKDLHQRTEWTGEQDGESLTQQLALQADGTAYDSLWSQNPFDADLAWYTYLIDTVPGTIDQYDPAFAGDRVRQRLRRDRSGRMGETSIAFGTTYEDVLHIGMAIGLTSVEMERTDVYTEQKVSGPSPLDRLTFNDRLQVSGSGGFWSFGLILQPNNAPIRLGWSYRSGSVFSIDDFYSVDATSDFSDGTGFEWNSPDSDIRYRIRTPRQQRLGFSWTLAKAALLTLDYGRSDFRTATFTSNDLYGTDVDRIQSELDSAFAVEQQFRGGLEFRIQDTWRFRMGGGWRSAAADPQTDFNGAIDGTLIEDGSGIVHWALGGEYRAEEWYAGATYRHTSTDTGRRLYALSPEVATGRTGLGLLMMSIGARF